MDTSSILKLNLKRSHRRRRQNTQPVISQRSDHKTLQLSDRSIFGQHFGRRLSPKKTIHVWEYDTEKKEVKKGGHRFKLTYCFLEATYIGGGKRRQEWYEPVISETIKK